MRGIPVASLIIGIASSPAERRQLAQLLGGTEAFLIVSSVDQAREFLGVTGSTAPAAEPAPVAPDSMPAPAGAPLSAAPAPLSPVPLSVAPLSAEPGSAAPVPAAPVWAAALSAAPASAAALSAAPVPAAPVSAGPVSASAAVGAAASLGAPPVVSAPAGAGAPGEASTSATTGMEATVAGWFGQRAPGAADVSPAPQTPTWEAPTAAGQSGQSGQIPGYGVSRVAAADPSQLTAAVVDAGDGAGTPSASGLRVDSDRRVLRWRDREIELTRLEHDLLLCLVGAPGRVWTYERLHQTVWGNEHLGRGSDMHSVVRRVRRKLVELGASATIHAVRGVGFRLAPA
ncbi:winged helix-turn-helix domain-containing protein [Micromonospora sp. NPDC049366]|uniref:winged helix-turn-helix domain-containing protein n=1 Tax=Micromonospora sp. NPDC049366 TaxID=3364271 RepID=UPI0037BE0E36